MKNYFRKNMRLRLLILFFISIILVYPQDAPKTSFTMAFFKSTLGDIDIKDADAALQIWVKTYKNKLESSLGEKIGFKYEIHQDYGVINRNGFTEKCNFINIPVIEFLKFNSDNRFEPILTGCSSDNKLDQYVIITNKNSPIKKLKDLRGSSLLLPNRKANDVVVVWLEVLLFENGLPRTDKCFSKTIESKSNLFSVNSVFFKSFDCSIVPKVALDLAFELNPQLKKNINVLYTSKPYIRNVLAVLKKLDEKTKKIVIEIGSTLKNDPDGEQILSLFKTYDIQTILPGDLDSVIKVFKKHQKYFTKK